MKTLILLVSFFISFTVSAKDITVIVNGSPGGTFYDRSMLYVENLKNIGYNVQQLDIYKNRAAAIKFLEAKEPTIMVWMDALAPVRPLQADATNFIALEYTAPLYLCAISGNESGNVGYPKMYVREPVLEMGDYKMLPYKNTGAVLNAALAGEIDFAYLNQGKALVLKQNGYPCKSVQGVAQHAVVLGINIDVNEIRKDILLSKQQSDFIEWLDKNSFNYDVAQSREEELATVLQSQRQWTSASQ